MAVLHKLINKLEAISIKISFLFFSQATNYPFQPNSSTVHSGIPILWLKSSVFPCVFKLFTEASHLLVIKLKSLSLGHCLALYYYQSRE